MAKPVYTLEQLASTDSLPCDRCEGTALTRPIGSIPARACPFCGGGGRFHAVDVPALLKLVKGRKAGALRSKRPESARAYYVWRMARFHGGADVTMPMQATFEVIGDPYTPYLDLIADKVAKQVYGTDLAGATRWARAMGMDVIDTGAPLPATAMIGGPVVTDRNKPYSEAPELV